MTLEQILEELSRRSIQLRRNGQNLGILAAEGVMDDEFVKCLRTHKESLLALIDTEDGSWWSPLPPNPWEVAPLTSLTEAQIEKIVMGVPGGRQNLQDFYPLTPLQEGIFFHHLLSTAGDAYILPHLLAFDDKQRMDKFVSCLQEVVNRHDILRTSIAWEELPDPLQVVWRKATLNVELLALNHNTNIPQELFSRFDHTVFRMNLREAPMLKLVAVYDEVQNRWLLLILMHHLVGDHTTLSLIRYEIGELFLGRGFRLPDPIPFRTMVSLTHRGMAREKHEAYFRSRLADVTEPTAPFGLMDVHLASQQQLLEFQLRLEPKLSLHIRERSRLLGLTAASMMHMAWALVLARLTGREDVVFGTVLFGRLHGTEGAERSLGLFINTLPIRVQLGAKTVSEGLRLLQEDLVELMRHEHASLVLAQRCSSVKAPAPLFTSLFNYRHSTSTIPSVQPETVQILEGIQVLSDRERTTYPITLSVDDHGEGFSFKAQVHSNFDP